VNLRPEARRVALQHRQVTASRAAGRRPQAARHREIVRVRLAATRAQVPRRGRQQVERSRVRSPRPHYSPADACGQEGEGEPASEEECLEHRLLRILGTMDDQSNRIGAVRDGGQSRRYQEGLQGRPPRTGSRQQPPAGQYHDDHAGDEGEAQPDPIQETHQLRLRPK
jgi:hypothetical protein